MTSLTGVLGSAFAALIVSVVILLSGRTLVGLLRDRRQRPLGPADAIVVFGAAIWADGPSPALRLRAERAAAAYLAGWAPVVIASGGLSRGRSEAWLMRGILVQEGVPANAVIADDGGLTTRRALRAVAAYGQGRWRRVIAVSSPYHLHRIVAEARRQGLEALPCPTHRPTTSWSLRRHDALQYAREFLASQHYAVSWVLEALSRWRILGCRPWSIPEQVAARLRFLLHDADAVARAQEELGMEIKARVAEGSETSTVLTPASGLHPPLAGRWSSGFGLRHGRLHAGIDIPAAYGTPVRAAAAGEVILADHHGPYGSVVVMHHGGGLATVYAHLGARRVSEGEQLEEGQPLGSVGDTGRSFGPHLHFEVRVHGSPVDPGVYLSGELSRRR